MQTEPKIHAFHRLSTGRIVNAAGIVHALRIVRSQPLDHYYRETLTSGGFGGTGRDVLRAFSAYCQAEINRRAGIVIPDMDTPTRQARLQRRLCARARASECKWCGQTLGSFIPQEWQRFCDPSCARSYRL